MAANYSSNSFFNRIYFLASDIFVQTVVITAGGISFCRFPSNLV